MKKIARLLTLLALALPFTAPAHAEVAKSQPAVYTVNAPDPCPWC